MHETDQNDASDARLDPTDERGTMPFRRVDVDGVAFDAVVEQDVLDHVFSSLDAGRGGLIFTVNTDILRQIEHHDEILPRSSLVVADGMPIVWASRIQGEALPDRVTGASLVPLMTRRAAARDRSVYFFGAAPGVAERAAANLAAEAPGLRVAGAYSPPLGFDQDPARLTEALERVAATKPDIVFVALGFPRQEKVALALLEQLPATWFVGCGGALDMAAGDLPRAHPVWQRLGAEWLHRLLKEPTRLGHRYLVQGVPFVAGLLARSVRARARRQH